MDWNLLFSSYANVFLDPTTLLMTLLGAAGGVLLGAIPGMTATMGVALLIPFSFGMDLIPSVGLLLGIYCGGMYGGSISAILIHAPGTPSAAATLLDGYPMAQKGEAGKALSVAMFSSFCGGVIGALIMTFLSPLVAKVAMKFTSAEMLMLAVFGLSVIISISGKSIAKGLISAFFGMLLCTIGLDPTYSKQRFTFGVTSLKGGLSFIPVLIGLFAVAEVIAGVERIIAGRESAQAKSTEKITRVLPDGSPTAGPSNRSGPTSSPAASSAPSSAPSPARAATLPSSSPTPSTRVPPSTPRSGAPASPTASRLPSLPTTAAPAAQ